MPEERAPFEERRPGDRLVIGGAAIFGVGLLATLVTLVPFFIGGDPLPLPVYLAAGLAPLGVGVALTGLVRAGRARRRRSRRPAHRHLAQRHPGHQHPTHQHPAHR
jgi:hypothetical protein